MNITKDKSVPQWWRKYVGGIWDEMGPYQLKVMKSLGMKPKHYLLDIGCGCFRGGRFFLDYLCAGNYFGIDADAEIVQIGIDKELTPTQRANLAYIISDDFNLNLAWNIDLYTSPPQNFDFLIAQSVFSHLPHEKFKQCIKHVNDFTKKGSIFVITVFEFDIVNPSPIGDYKYLIEDIRKICGEEWAVIPAKYEHVRKQSWFVLIRQ